MGQNSPKVKAEITSTLPTSVLSRRQVVGYPTASSRPFPAYLGRLAPIVVKLPWMHSAESTNIGRSACIMRIDFSLLSRGLQAKTDTMSIEEIYVIVQLGIQTTILYMGGERKGRNRGREVVHQTWYLLLNGSLATGVRSISPSPVGTPSSVLPSWAFWVSVSSKSFMRKMAAIIGKMAEIGKGAWVEAPVSVTAAVFVFFVRLVVILTDNRGSDTKVFHHDLFSPGERISQARADWTAGRRRRGRRRPESGLLRMP